jgi:hypothetical protein
MAQHNDVIRLAAEQAAEIYERQHNDPQGFFTGVQYGHRLCKIAGVKRELLPPAIVRVILAGRSDIEVMGVCVKGLYKLA